ncbi:MAG TPA: cation transporter, partial [Chloroflexota bacterium]
AEQRAARLIALTLWAVAGYVAVRAVMDLAGLSERPEQSPLGLAVLILAALVMASLALGKRHVARRLESRALAADARQTLICLELSVVVIMGLAANWLLGWWWADPLAGLGVAALAAREGWEAWASGELEGSVAPLVHCFQDCCAECPVLA